MPSVPQHRSSSLEIWGRGEAKSFLLESRAGSIISRWQARARNLACLLTQSHSFQKLEMPPTKSAWGSSTSLRIWRQLPSSSDHHPISLSPPIQILSWNIGKRKNELQGVPKKMHFQNFQGYVWGQIFLVILNKHHCSLHFRLLWSFWLFWPFFLVRSGFFVYFVYF